MKRVSLIMVSLLLLFPMALIAGGSDEAASQTTTVSIWGWRTQDEAVFEEVQKVLQEKGESITLEFESYKATEYDSKVLLAFQAGTAPDVFLTRRLPGQRTQALIDNGYLVPLDDRVDFSNFTAATLGFIQSDGKTWGVPFANQIVGIFYNTDIFDEHGLSEAETWDELLEICKKLDAAGVTPFMVPGKAGWALAMQHAMTGVSVPGQDWIGTLIRGETNFMDPAFIEINTRLNDLKQYYQKDFIANSTEEMDAGFALGQAAMVFYGIWGGTNWKTLNPDFKYGYFPVPPADKSVSAAAYVYMDGSYGMNAATKVEDAAIKVLSFTATPEYGTIFSRLTGEMTAVKGATLPSDNEVLVEGYETSTRIGARNIYWVGSPFQKGTPTVYDILREGMQAMYLDKMSPTELAQQIQDSVGAWYPLKK